MPQELRYNLPPSPSEEQLRAIQGHRTTRTIVGWASGTLIALIAGITTCHLPPGNRLGIGPDLAIGTIDKTIEHVLEDVNKINTYDGIDSTRDVKVAVLLRETIDLYRIRTYILESTTKKGKGGEK